MCIVTIWIVSNRKKVANSEVIFDQNEVKSSIDTIATVIG